MSATVVETNDRACVNVQGPREDTGFMSDTNPGIAMVERIFNLCHQAYPKTKVMVSGIRKPEGALPSAARPFKSMFHPNLGDTVWIVVNSYG